MTKLKIPGSSPGGLYLVLKDRKVLFLCPDGGEKHEKAEAIQANSL